MVHALKKSLVLITLTAALALALSFAYSVNVSAQEGEDQSNDVTQEETQTTEATTENTDESSEQYDFVAQSGDSYSLMARKATQIYGFESQTSLSEAQIIFVETNLTQAAGSPLLDLDEAVSVDKGLVGEWVEKAKGLTDAEKAAWQVYADNADFNTDNVGEVRE